MKISHINKLSYSTKGHFLTFWKEWFKKVFPVDNLPDSQVFLDEMDTNKFSRLFHICLTRLANNKISTFKIKVSSSIFVQNWLEVEVILSIPKWRLMTNTCFPTSQKGLFWRSIESCSRKCFLGASFQAPKCLSKELIPWYLKSAFLSMTYIWKAVGLYRPTRGAWRSRRLPF